MEASEQALSLYVHVPFCTDKCLYCDFFSVPRGSVIPATMRNVVEETLAHAERLIDAAGPGARVETIFVGGGTPSCLPPPLRARLLGAFTSLHPSEWTVESNPETLDEGFLDECAKAGVTRLSVGIQSFNPRHLETLRRHCTREHALAAVHLLRERWRGQLNLDFITGIPGQTVSEVRDDLDVLGGGWPDHVSLYQLTVEPGTPLEHMVDEGSLRLNRGEQDEELWLAGRDELLKRGYIQYEVSNFCMPGRECRHNLRYWRIQPYAGAGPGAVSTLPAEWAARAASRPALAEGGAPVVRFTAPRDIPTFLQGENRFWGAETESITARDFLLENVMMGLRLSGGISESVLRSRFGHGFAHLFPGVWEDWVTRGLAVPPDGTLRLTDAGLLLLDRLLGELFERREMSSPPNLRLQWPP